MAKRIYILIPGGLEHAGGIGRVMGYLIAAWSKCQEGPYCHVLDTRGPGHIVWSPLYFARALSTIVISALSGNVLALHVNLSHGGSTLRKAIVLQLAALLKIPAVLHLNSSSYHEFYRELPGWAQNQIRLMFARARKTIVVGQYWKRFLVSEVCVRAECIEVIYNGVPDSRRRLGSYHTNDSRHIGCKILFLGRLGKRKGTPDLLAALSHESLRNLTWSATLAGDGDVNRYRAAAEALGLSDRVMFTGWVDQARVQYLLSEADIMVLPSYNEGLPLAILEALAASVTVITTPVGAIPEIIESEISGFLVEPGDLESLTATLKRLIVDPSLRQVIGGAGRANFELHANIDLIASRILNIYQEISDVRIVN